MEKCSCMKAKRNSSKANYASKHAPPFCEIWFIYKGKHIWTRETSETPHPLSSYAQSETTTLESVSCRSIQHGMNEIFHSECLQSHSIRPTVSTGSGCLVQSEIIETEAMFSSKSSCCSSHCSSQNSARSCLDTHSEVEEEIVNSQYIEAKREADTAIDEAFAEKLKCKRLEVKAFEAINKVNIT